MRIYSHLSVNLGLFLIPGVSIPQRQWCISALFQIPPIFENLSVSMQLQFYLFPNKISIFIHLNFWWRFFNNFSPPFVRFFCFLCVFFFTPVLTMMHLCIIQYAYWMPLLDPATETVSLGFKEVLGSAFSNLIVGRAEVWIERICSMLTAVSSLRPQHRVPEPVPSLETHLKSE